MTNARPNTPETSAPAAPPAGPPEAPARPPRRRYPSPLRVLLTIAAAIFLGEAAIMLLLMAARPLDPVLALALDALTLTALVFPVLYFFIYRPMAEHIAEIRRAEEEIHQLNRELEQRIEELAAANRALETFSYSVSHDLRSPLQVIGGFSQALLEDCSGQLDERGRDYLGRIRATAVHMAQLIDDLLRLASVTRAEMKLEEVDLSALVRSIADELRAREPRRSVECAVAERLVAEGDARLLRIALENLLRNAWKFTSTRAHARIQFGANGAPDGRRTFFLCDNGAGFDMARADRLFAPFIRLHPDHEFPGTGIGLAIVRRIVERHGGRIWAEAAVDRGATFHFTLSELPAGVREGARQIGYGHDHGFPGGPTHADPHR